MKSYACFLVVIAAAALPQSAIAEDVTSKLDIVYATYGQRELHLDLFTPAKDRGPKPGVIIVHGGGWLNGDKSKFHPIASDLAARGYVVAAMEYRLGGEAKFPAAIHDCHAAVRWMRANAEKYGVDPNRIAAVGGSAGGHLVGLLAATADVEELHGDGGHADQSSAVQAAVVMAGPLELASGPVADKSRNKPNQSNTNKWLGKTIDEAPELYKLASATTHFSKQTPPILFLTGEYDNPQRNADARSRLRELGVRTGVRVYKLGKHGCWNRDPWDLQIRDDIDEFLRSVFDFTDSYDEYLTEYDEWGKLIRGPGWLSLQVEKVPANRRLTISRFNNPIGKMPIKGVDRDVALTLKPELDSWAVVLPDDEALKPPFEIIVETMGLPRTAGLVRVVSQADDHAIVLAAHNAQTKGRLLRYEPQPHKNTIGYWADEKDSCHWCFYVEHPGRFDVHILQGCGKGQGGSEVTVSVARAVQPDAAAGERQESYADIQRLKYVVEDTGHFQNFKDCSVGAVALSEPGVYVLQIVPDTKAQKAVMDVRQMRLVPRRGDAAK